jgi:hypothetical protein
MKGIKVLLVSLPFLVVGTFFVVPLVAPVSLYTEGRITTPVAKFLSAIPGFHSMLEQRIVSSIQSYPDSKLFIPNDTASFTNIRGLFLGFSGNKGKLILRDGGIKAFELSSKTKVYCLPTGSKKNWVDNEPDIQVASKKVYSGERAKVLFVPYQSQLILSSNRDEGGLDYIRVLDCITL